MDALDDQILRELRRNGRISFADLGAQVGLSPHAAAARVRRLQDRGVITGFTVTVAAGALDRHLDAVIDIRLRPETPPEDFEAQAARLPAVREVIFLTGRADYQLRVACNDADDLDRTVRALRQRGGVAATETRIVLKSYRP